MRQIQLMKVALLILPLLATTACATKPLVPVGPDGAVISISHDPAWMSRTWYSFELSADGHGRLSWSTGAKHDATTHVRKFKVSPQAFVNLEADLRKLRPMGNRIIDGNDSSCGEYVNDQGAVRVTWTGRGPTGLLVYDYGCDNDLNRQLVKILESASISAVPLDMKSIPIWKLLHLN